MLRSIQIDNMAVIRSVEFLPGEGLTVVTGETGAGKSIMIDCISLLLGERTSRGMIRTGEDSATVRAVFDRVGARAEELMAQSGLPIEDGEIEVSRTICADGRSVCRINGRSVAKKTMSDVCCALISLHGQNDSFGFSADGGETDVVDLIAQNAPLLDEYAALYSSWQRVRGEIRDSEKSEGEKLRLRDMLEFQIKEISACKLKAGEEEALLDERKKLQSMEKIKKQTDIAKKAVCFNEKGITASFLVMRAADALQKLSEVSEDYANLAGRLRSCAYEIDDAASEIDALSQDDVADPTARLDKIESRLAQINKLKLKYGSTAEEILAFCSEAERRLGDIVDSDARRESLALREAKLRGELLSLGADIGERRRKAASDIESSVVETLAYLDMPSVRFFVFVSPTDEPTPRGCDVVRFLFSANPGEPPRELSSVASGGELARVMLAVKCAAASERGVGTLVFDEIDSGVSGKTARKIGIKLKYVSKAAQVICVTHSAQIASLGDLHIKIAKAEREGRTESFLTVLDRESRIEETARILGGISVTAAQRQAAVDMINESQDY